MSEPQNAGDDTKPELQLFQQRRPFPHSASAQFPFAKHMDGKRMGITDPAAASLGCNLPAAQLYQGLPEAIVEVPVPTARQDGTGMIQSANTSENRTLITLTIGVAPAKGGSAGSFSGSCCHQGVTRRSAHLAELLNPRIMGCCISWGVLLASFEAKTQRKGALPWVSVGTSNTELMEQGTSPTYSTVTAVLLSRPGTVV